MNIKQKNTGSIGRALQVRGRRAIALWRRLDSSYGWRWRVANFFAALLILSSVFISLFEHFVVGARYKLSDETLALVGDNAPALAGKLKYNPSSKVYEFNKDAVKEYSPADTLRNRVGQSKDQQSLYALDVHEDVRQGVKYYDVNSKLSFSLKPEYGGLSGKIKQGRLVYPLYNGAQAVYTLKNNGFKEDIVVEKTTKNTMRFDYKLELPKTLQAKLLPDGSVGIYGADPVLSGNMSYGSDKDRKLIEKAREKADKTHLVFAIPAPTVVTSTGDSGANPRARFELKAGRLSVIAEGLKQLSQPFSIDPSVVITSTADFLSGNRAENIDFSANQIARGALTGGGLSAGWGNAGGTTIPEAMGGGSIPTNRTVVVNGRVYFLGGSISGSVTTSIYYADIGGGTIGTWSTATSTTPTAFPVGTTFTAYNGVIYGFGAHTSGHVLTGSKLAVSITPDPTTGNITGSWTTLTSPGWSGTERTYPGVVAYDGYMYVLGGCTAKHTLNPTCSTAGNSNDVYSAPIYANGTLGTWTTVFANAAYSDRNAPAVFAYNGYMYVAGGCEPDSDNSGNCQIAAGPAGASTDIWRAKIGPGGTLSAFTLETNSLLTSRQDSTITAHNGYMYAISGCDPGTSCNAANPVTTSEYAPIYADGSVGKWTTTSMATAGNDTTRYGQGVLGYDGYIYQIGGCGTNAGNCGSAYVNNSVSALIDPAGYAGSYASTSSFTTTRRGGQTVVYNDRLYVMGGDNGGTPVNTIYAATISASGSLGAFTATGMTAFTTNRTFFAAVAHDGYMYVLGGCSSAFASCTTAGNNLGTVYKSTIASDGTLGSWTAQTNITTDRYGLSAVAYNGVMYVMGGINGSTFQSDIQYQAFGASGVLTGTWSNSAQTISGAARAYFGAAAYGGRLYIVGGCSAGALTCTTTRNDTLHAPLTSGGDLTSALVTTGNGTAFSNTRGMIGLTAADGYLYMTGGWDGSTYYNTTHYAPINTDGSVGTWATTGSALANNIAGQGTVAYKGTLYVAGGYNGTTYYDTVQYAPIGNGGGGDIASAWDTGTTSFTTARYEHGTVVSNGYMYVLGGRAGGGGEVSTIVFGAIGSNGRVASWSTASNNPSWYSREAYATYGGFIYKLGGKVNSTYYDNVSYAAVCTGQNNTVQFGASSTAFDSGSDCNGSSTPGSLTAWRSTSTLTQARGMLTAVAYGGYIYALGGCNGSNGSHTCISVVNTAESAQINADGSLGTWQAQTGFTTGRARQASTVYNGYVYILGGCTTFSGDDCSSFLGDVQFAKLNNGALDGCSGTWCAAASFFGARDRLDATASNGYIYLTGGGSASSQNNSDTQYAAIGSLGALGRWKGVATSFGTGRYGHSALTHDSKVYVVGGCSNATLNCATGGARQDVQFGGPRSIVRIGRWSKLIDLGATANIYSFNFGTSVAETSGLFSYRAGASSSVDYTASGNVLDLSWTRCSGLNGVRYLQLSTAIDDSSRGVFPDTSPGVVTDVTVSYEAKRAPAQRMRLGKTLQAGVLSDLDICKITTL